MDITLYEQYDKKKLEEVISCNNIPFETTDDKEWVDIFKNQIKKYYKKKYTDKGIEIKYIQKNNFGRYTTRCGLQGFQKDVRKYISGEYVRDFDFKNCHPVILEQLLKKNDIYCGSFLEEYNKNRNEVMEKNGIKDKTVLIKMMNNENEPLGIFKDLHSRIYNTLFPKLKKENDNLYKVISSGRKKKYNMKGSFISHYLQNIENQMLMSFYNYLNEKFIKVHSLMFDGLTIDKVCNFDVKEAEDRIFKDTGYRIEIVEKSTHTDWKPVVNSNIDLYKEIYDEGGDLYDVSYNYKLFKQCFKASKDEYDYEAVDALHNYLNKFVCKINYPHSYGIRFDTKDQFEMRSSEKVKDRIRHGFETADPICWKNSNKALTYNRFIFEVDSKKVKKNEYNLYKRPAYKECDSLNERAPLFVDFLKRIISSNSEEVFDYLNNYIAKMVQVGNTKQSIVLMGNMGVGKTVFTTILKLIVEEVENEYSKNINDISDMMNRFNSMDFKCIITTIEEVVNRAGEFHSVQNKLKDLITADYIKLEKKGVDAFMVPNNNNLIIITNNVNPVYITEDNRRYLVIRVSDAERNNSNYFINLINQVKENIEYIRGYFYRYKFVDNLNRIRPITDEERDLLKLNMPSDIEYIKYMLEEFIGESEEMELNDIYKDYVSFCGRESKKLVKKEYFSKALKNNGYITERRRGDNSIRKRYVRRNRE